MDDVTLVLVCKRPAPGVGKQRLTMSLGNEMTQQIATALLACALEDACDWSDRVVIAPAMLRMPNGHELCRYRSPLR